MYHHCPGFAGAEGGTPLGGGDWVRHPLYLGLLLLYLGGCLALGSWVGLGLWAVVFLPFHVLRALREEGFLIEKHGEEYLRYMDSAGFLWPRLPGPPAA